MWFTLGPAEWPQGSWPLVSNQTTSWISYSQPFSAALILVLRPLFLSQRQCHCVLVRRQHPHKRKKSNYWMKEMLKESEKKYLELPWRIITFEFSSVQSLRRVWLFATPWTAAHQASLSITKSRSPPKPMSIESMMAANHLILCCPLLLLPSIFPSIRVFPNESALRIRWPKYWSFSFSITPSNEHPGLISFRMDWLDLLAVQRTLKSLLQHHSSKASILQHSAFFIVQLSHPLEKGMANHFSILALRTPWTVWKGRKIGHWKMNCAGQ